MGLTFPLLLGRVARYATVSSWVGRLTAVNTVGAVAGSLLTGYFALPALGSQRLLGASAMIFAFAAVATALVQSEKSRRFAGHCLSATRGCSCSCAPRWDLGSLTSGANVYFDMERPPDEILMVEEDVYGGVTTVVRRDQVTTLYTNGKFQGNTGWEMNAQRFFAHYPQLFVDHFDKALVIGLGTGTTLGAIAGYPWQSIERRGDLSGHRSRGAQAFSRRQPSRSRGHARSRSHRGWQELSAPRRRALSDDQHGAVEHLVCWRSEPVQSRVLSHRSSAPHTGGRVPAVGSASSRHAPGLRHRPAHFARWSFPT